MRVRTVDLDLREAIIGICNNYNKLQLLAIMILGAAVPNTFYLINYYYYYYYYEKCVPGFSSYALTPS